jgi:hypothetical protein
MTYLPFKEEVKQQKTAKQIFEDQSIENRVKKIIKRRSKYLWAAPLGFLIAVLCVAAQLIIFL